MNKKIFAMMSAVMAVVMSLSFVSCGDDEKESETPPEEPQVINYDEALVGTWSGSGTTYDNYPITVSARFNADKTGTITMKVPAIKASMTASIYHWNYGGGKRVLMSSEKFDSELYWDIISGSVEAGEMKVESEFFEGKHVEYWSDDLTLKKSNKGSSNGTQTGDANISLSWGNPTYLSSLDKYKLEVTVKVHNVNADDVSRLGITHSETKPPLNNDKFTTREVSFTRKIDLRPGKRYYIRGYADLSDNSTLETIEEIDLR